MVFRQTVPQSSHSTDVWGCEHPVFLQITFVITKVQEIIGFFCYIFFLDNFYEDALRFKMLNL